MLISKLLFVLISLSYSPRQNITNFPRIICYESFSMPKIYLPLHMHTYTGPQYINVAFNIRIKHSKVSEIKSLCFDIFYFKKVEGSCDYFNITFTSNREEFYELFIRVALYLPLMIKPLSVIEYSIRKEFTPDKYLLIDEHGNFGISAKITNSLDMSLQGVAGDEKEAINYLRKLKYKGSSHICFVTPFNIQDSIMPFFQNENIKKGHIVGITIEKSDVNIKYPAFECDVPEDYDTQTYFVFEDDEPKFFSRFVWVTEKKDEESGQERFLINKNNYKTIEKMSNIKNSNPVFLMRDRIISCNDYTDRKVYESRKKYYYASRRIILEVAPYIKRHKWISCDPLNPCA